MKGNVPSTGATDAARRTFCWFCGRYHRVDLVDSCRDSTERFSDDDIAKAQALDAAVRNTPPLDEATRERFVERFSVQGWLKWFDQQKGE